MFFCSAMVLNSGKKTKWRPSEEIEETELFVGFSGHFTHEFAVFYLCTGRSSRENGKSRELLWIMLQNLAGRKVTSRQTNAVSTQVRE